MRRFKAEFSPGLPFAPNHSTPLHSKAFNWAYVLGLILLGSCSTIDSNNKSDRPWDRPTKADVSKGLVVRFRGTVLEYTWGLLSMSDSR
jgi:hypothetical protein